jgi:hypothetical protein
MTGFCSQNELRGISRTTLLILPLLVLLVGCDWGGTQTLPGQMVGDWRTDEPRYLTRFIKLEADRVTFGLGGLGPDKVEHIEKVKMAPRDNPTDYTIRLTAGDGTPDSIVVQFTPQNGGELRLKNQPKIVWKRRSEPSRTPPPGQTPQPGTPPQKTPPPETPPPDHVYGEHMTIYKIDCLKPDACRSY